MVEEMLHRLRQNSDARNEANLRGRVRESTVGSTHGTST